VADKIIELKLGISAECLAGHSYIDMTRFFRTSDGKVRNWSLPFTCPTHTALPIPFDLRRRRYLVPADEDMLRPADAVLAFMWMVDIAHETRPVLVGNLQVEGIEGNNQLAMAACHQPCEKLTGTAIPFARSWHGPRRVDLGPLADRCSR
jgi:hypothetical protein